MYNDIYSTTLALLMSGRRITLDTLRYIGINHTSAMTAIKKANQILRIKYETALVGCYNREVTVFWLEGTEEPPCYPSVPDSELYAKDAESRCRYVLTGTIYDVITVKDYKWKAVANNGKTANGELSKDNWEAELIRLLDRIYIEKLITDVPSPVVKQFCKLKAMKYEKH